MVLVENVQDILENAKRFDEYLAKGNKEEREFALQTLYAGRCFVVVRHGDEYKFYPSKYIGYKNNSESNYYEQLGDAVPISSQQEDRYGDAALYTFDGRMSNKAINKVLKCTCVKDNDMSEKFIEYCNKFGLKGSYKRKFWLEIIEQK